MAVPGQQSVPSPVLSIVVPLFNEDRNVTPLLKRLTEMVRGLAIDYEIVLVDDGSRDDTWHAVRSAAAKVPRVHGVRLSRNFGHQHALLAGLGAARGQAVVSMDGDLQHPPELIPEMLAEWRQGAEIVQTRRVYSRHTPAMKRLTSRYYYRLFTFLSGTPLQEGQSDFRLLDRKVLDQILAFGDSEMFLRGAVQWVGFRTRTIKFTAAERHAGRSSYGLARMLRLATAGILSFSVKPLTLSIWLGFWVSALAFLELAYVLYTYTQGATVQGWASTLGILSVLFGVLFLVIGIIGLYIGRIHQALFKRPRYIVQELAAPTPAHPGHSTTRRSGSS
jgi:polyisoprenyl-phosphate glycosyltransferase